MSNNYGPRIVTDGLVLCLDAADRNSYAGSGTIVTDLSGGGNNATFAEGTSAPSFSNDNGGAFLFSGDYMYINSNASLMPAQISFGCWVMLTGGNNYRVIFCGKGDGASNATTSYWIEKETNNRFRVFISASGTALQLYANTNTSVELNRWYHVFATYNGSIAQMYIDGRPNGSPVSFSGSTTSTSGILSIGRLGSYNYNLLPGKIASFYIYNIGLSADQVLQNYNATKGRFGL